MVKALTVKESEKIDTYFLKAFEEEPEKLADRDYRRQIRQEVAKKLQISQAQVDRQLRSLDDREAVIMRMRLHSAIEHGSRLMILRFIEGMNALNEDEKPDLYMRHKYVASFARALVAVHESNTESRSEAPQQERETNMAQRQAGIVAEREMERVEEAEVAPSRLITHSSPGHHAFDVEKDAG